LNRDAPGGQASRLRRRTGMTDTAGLGSHR
jgi:hypothetical protein